MAIREGEVNRWLAWCSDEQTGMLQQRPTRASSRMMRMMQGMLAMRSETLELPRHSFCSEYSGQCSVVALEVSEYRLNVMQVCGSYVSCVQGASSMSKIAAPAGLCQSSVFSNWRSASMDTAVTS
ncbi:unnamed protein product [Effrenium voratum]|nr:unnamed protein product [Effrenium voratum]